MKRALPLLLVLAAGLGIGYVFGRSGGSSDTGLAPAPSLPPRATPATPPPEMPSPAAGDDARLRARVAELEDALAKTEAALEAARDAGPAPAKDQPVRDAGESGDPATGTLRVLVTDDGGQPIAGAKVTSHLSRQGRTAESRTEKTGPDGVAEFEDLEPGRRYVWVTRSGGSRAHYTPVSAGRITEARFPMPAGSARLEVTVRDATKGPLEKVSLALSREGEYRDNFHATTDAEGRALFSELPAGDYSLRASGGAVGYSRHPSKPVSVPEGGRLSEEIVVGVVGLHGTVRDRSTGNPIPGVRVTIQDGAPYRSVSSDADGVYRFLDLAAGTVSGVASKKGYGIHFWKKVEVPEDGRTYDIDLDPAARLAIRITDPKGRPFVGRLYIGVHPKVGGTGTNVGTSVTADDTGLARYDEIVPGDYDLTFRADGVGNGKVEAKIVPGDNSIDVRLE